MLKMTEVPFGLTVCPLPHGHLKILSIPLIYVLIIFMLMVQTRVYLKSWGKSGFIIILGGRATAVLGFITDARGSDWGICKTWQGTLRWGVRQKVSLKIADCGNTSGQNMGLRGATKDGCSCNGQRIIPIIQSPSVKTTLSCSILMRSYIWWSNI